MQKFIFHTSLIFLLPVFYFSQTTVTLSANRDAAIGYHDGASTDNNNYGMAPHLADGKLLGVKK